LQAQRTIVAALAGFGVTTGVAASAGLMGGLGVLEGAAGVEQVGQQTLRRLRLSSLIGSL